MSAVMRLGAVSVVVGAVLAGCGSGPSQVNSAVIIGGKVITVDDVQHRLDNAVQNEPAAKDLAKNRKLDLVSREIVNRLIRHELITEAARRENLSVSEKDVSDAVTQRQQAQQGQQAQQQQDPIQKAADAGFDPRELARDRLLTQSLGRKHLEGLQVTFAGLQVVSNDARKKSEDVARKVAAAPGQASQIFDQAAGGGQDAQTIPQFQLTPRRAYDIAAQNQVLLTPLFGLAKQSVVAFPLGQGEQAASTGWIVALIQNRELDAPPLQGQQAGSPAEQIPPEWFELVGRQLSAPLAGELGIRISPRYGIWDELAVGVAPSEGEKFGLVVHPAGAAQQ